MKEQNEWTEDLIQSGRTIESEGEEDEEFDDDDDEEEKMVLEDPEDDDSENTL